MNIGLRIKKIRKFKDLTQEYVAGEIGLDQSTYSRMEKGEIDITVDRFIKIASVLDVEPEYILSFDKTGSM